MKRRVLYSCLFSTSLILSMVSCSEEVGLNGDRERNVTMTVNIDLGENTTRSVLSEDAGDLKCTWESTDLVLVVDKAGNKLGVLNLISGAGEESATFKGTLTTSAEGDEEVNFMYLGAASEEELKALGNPVTIDYSSQDGSLGWLMTHDFFSATRSVNFANSAVDVESVSLARQLAFGNFELSLPEGVTYGGEEISVFGSGVYTHASVSTTGGCVFSNPAGSEGEIKVSPVADEKGEYPSSFYLTVLPNAGEMITPTISVTIDDMEYSCTLGEREWTASEYVRKDNGDGTYSAIVLDMQKADVAPAFDDLVGPVIEIGGKRYRFVKGNLYYDINDKSWHLYEKETHFSLLAGTSSFYKSTYVMQINGKPVSASNHLIDLFAWGATGLGDPDDQGRSKLPDIIREGIAGEVTWAGSNWPCYNTNTMDVNGNASITDLWGSYTFTEPIYDFGYAYMQNGRPAGDNRRFVTAPLEAYAYICDQSRSFSQGCIVKGAGLNGEDVKGALIILGVTDAATAKEKIESVGGTTKNLKKLNVAINNAGFDFQITLPNYECIEKLGAMFFGLAGSSTWSKSQQLAKDCGNYWTKNGSKGSSADANGHSFFFRKASTASEFHWVVGRNGVSKTRRTQNSVRLMVEITD